MHLKMSPATSLSFGDSPHKGPVMRKTFPYQDVVMFYQRCVCCYSSGHTVCWLNNIYASFKPEQNVTVLLTKLDSFAFKENALSDQTTSVKRAHNILRSISSLRTLKTWTLQISIIYFAAEPPSTGGKNPILFARAFFITSHLGALHNQQMF